MDSALCDDPEFMRDRFRAMRPFATGNLIGGVNEEAIISRGGHDFPTLDVDDWVIVQGNDDNHNSFEDVTAYYRAQLPNTPIIEVPGGGRFMTSSHPDLVVEQLNRLAVRDYGRPDVSSCQKPTLMHPAGNGGYVPGAVFHP